MIFQVVFLLAIILTVTVAAVDGIATAARASLDRKMATYAALGSRAELQAVQREIATTISNDPSYKRFTTGTLPSVQPSPIALLGDVGNNAPAVFTAAGSALTTADDYQIQTKATLSSSNCTGTSCLTVATAQLSGWVQEARLSITLTSSIYPVATFGQANAPPAAVRSQYATVRLYAQPPFLTVTGIKDAASSDPGGFIGSTAIEGDSGGLNVTAPTVYVATPVPAATAAGNGDTSVHLVYQCSGAPCSLVATPRPDFELGGATQRSYAWTNGNSATGWSR